MICEEFPIFNNNKKFNRRNVHKLSTAKAEFLKNILLKIIISAN